MGFQRVKLQAGETKTVVLDITPESLASFDVNMKYTVENTAQERSSLVSPK